MFAFQFKFFRLPKAFIVYGFAWTFRFELFYRMFNCSLQTWIHSILVPEISNRQFSIFVTEFRLEPFDFLRTLRFAWLTRDAFLCYRLCTTNFAARNQLSVFTFHHGRWFSVIHSMNSIVMELLPVTSLWLFWSEFSLPDRLDQITSMNMPQRHSRRYLERVWNFWLSNFEF